MSVHRLSDKELITKAWEEIHKIDQGNAEPPSGMPILEEAVRRLGLRVHSSPQRPEWPTDHPMQPVEEHTMPMREACRMLGTAFLLSGLGFLLYAGSPTPVILASVLAIGGITFLIMSFLKKGWEKKNV